MRVAMISDYYDTDGKTDGGVQTVTKYLVEEMSRIDGLDLHVGDPVDYARPLSERSNSVRCIRQLRFSARHVA